MLSLSPMDDAKSSPKRERREVLIKLSYFHVAFQGHLVLELTLSDQNQGSCEDGSSWPE